MYMDAYITPTNDTDHIKAIKLKYLTNHKGSIAHHSTPLVINSLGGRHTHKHANTHTHIDIRGQKQF